MLSKIQRTSIDFRTPAVNNGMFAVLSLVGSALSYLLYPVLARVITPSQFGDVSLVIALAGQIGGLLLAFNVVSIYVVHTFEKDHALRITEIIQKFVIQALLAATLVVLVVSPWLVHLLKVSSAGTFVGLGLLLLLNVPAVVWTGFLQGHNELARIGIYNTVVAAAKLVLAVGLCLAGFGAVGAVAGILLGQLIGLWAIRMVPGTYLPSITGTTSRIKAVEIATVRPLVRYVGEALVVVGVFSILFAIDIVLAKGFYSPHQAGLYAGVAALGRIVFFGASILTWIMLANLTTHDPAKSRATLRRYTGLIAGFGAVIVGGFWVASSLIVSLSLGHTYSPMSSVLWLAGLNQLVASLLYAYTLYLLVLRRSHPALLAVLSCALAIAGGAALHFGGPGAMLVGLLGGQIFGYVAYVVLVSGLKLIRRNP